MRSVVVLHVGLILTVAYTGHAETQTSGVKNNAVITESMRRLVPALAHAAVGLQRPAAPSPDYGWNECYSCINCPSVHYNTTIKHCGYPPVKCVVYAQKYMYLPQTIYVRGCANERGSCEEISRSHEENANLMTLVSCAECTGDKCNTNGATNTFSSLASAIFFLVFTPMLMKYAMS